MIINLSKWGQSGGGSGGGVTEEQAHQISFDTIQEELQDNGGTIHDAIDAADMSTAENVKTELRKNVIKEQFNNALDAEFRDGTIITVPKGSDFEYFTGKWHHDKFIGDSRTNNIPSVPVVEDANPLNRIDGAYYLAFIRNESKEVAGQTYHGISFSVPQSIAGDFDDGIYYMHGQKSLDGGINLNWDETPYEFGTEVDFEEGSDVILFYNTIALYPENGFTKVNDPADFTTNEYSHFTVGRPVDLAGNILGLLSINEYDVEKIPDWSFAYLFENQSNIIDASKLSLFEVGHPDYIGNYYVGKHAFSHIFKGCTGLETFNHYAFCVKSDRQGNGYCGLDDSALSAFFEGCTSLTTAPELPTDLVSKYTYDYMFKGCTSLTTAPSVLPATRLDLGTYRGMFYGCTGLTKAPVLPNPSDNSTIPSEAYNFMFDGCTNLSNIKTFFTSATVLDNTNAQNWLNGIAASGTYLGVVNTYVPAGWSYVGPNDSDWGYFYVGFDHSDVRFNFSISSIGRNYSLNLNGQALNYTIYIPYINGGKHQMWISEDIYVVGENVAKNKWVVDIYYKNGQQHTLRIDSPDPFAYTYYPSVGDVNYRPIVKDEEWLKIDNDWYYRGDANNHAYDVYEVEAFASTIQALWNDYKITSRRESDGAIYNGSWQEAITTQNQGGCVCLKKGDLWTNTQILSVIVVDSQNNNALTIYNNPSQVMYNTLFAVIGNTSAHINGLISNPYYPDQYNRWRIYISYEGSFLEAHIEVDPEGATVYPSDAHLQAVNYGMLVASGYNAKLGGDVLVIIKKDNGNLVTVYAGLKKDYEKIVVGNAQSYTIWNGTQAEYDALTSYDANKIYLIQ